MNWIERRIDTLVSNLGFVKAADVPANPIFAQEAPSKVGGGNALGSNSSDREERLAYQSSWVFSNISLIANEVATSKPFIRERLEGESFKDIVDHPFERIMDRPNPYMGISFLMRYTATWLELRGEAYWLLMKDKTGNLAEIWPLPADRVEPIPDSKQFVSGFLYRPKEGMNKPVVLEADRVCYFRTPNPFNYHRGLSKLGRYSMALNTDRLAAKWNEDTIRNQATLRTILSMPANVSQRNYEQIKGEIVREIASGSRWIVVRGGELSADSVGMSQQDLEYLAGREFNREEIDRVFGVPSGLWDKSATEANAKVAKSILIEQTVWPLLMLIQEEINSQILPKYYDGNFAVGFTDIRPINRQIAMDEKKLDWESMTVDEVREAQGRDPHPNPIYGAVPYPMRHNQAIGMLLAKIADRELLAEEGVDPLADERMSEVQLEIAERGEPAKSVEPESSSFALKASPELTDKQLYDELMRWKSIAARAFKRGEPREFHSGIISQELQANIRHMIACSDTLEQVKSSFYGAKHSKAGADLELDEEAAQSAILAFAAAMKRLVKSLKSGGLEQPKFESELEQLVRTYYERMYMIGSGNPPTGEEERSELDSELALALAAIPLLSSDVKAGLFDEDTEGRIERRTGLWLTALALVYNMGKSRSGKLLQWRLGNTEDHCSTCIRLNGQKKSGQEWREGGYLPQSRALECGGWNCDCSLVEVNAD